MNIRPLNPFNPHHTHIVVSCVVQSTLDYGDLDADARLLVWQSHQGKWAVATTDDGAIAGIVCVVNLHDRDNDALLWLEVLPHYRRNGIGTALLLWAQAQTQRELVIKSVSGAFPFYQHVGIGTVALSSSTSSFVRGT